MSNMNILKLLTFINILSILLTLQSCFILPGKGKNTIVFDLKNQPRKVTFNPSLASIDIANDIVTINGSGFSKVTEVKIQGTGVDVGFNVDSLTDSKIIASAKSALSLLVGSTFNLIISSAEASTTFPITFTLSDGVVTNTKLHSMGAQPGQVLQFNGTNWLPASFASPMNFIGMWDAGSGSPTAGAYSDGDYYILSGDGSYGTDNYVVGDWAVFDGSDWIRVFTDAGTKLSKTGGTLTGDLILDTQAKFKGAANYVTLKASAGLTSDITLTLPTSVGTNGQVLTTNGSGVLSWETVASGGGTGAVYSVNSQTGTVTLTTTDIAEGTNQYFTTARALSAVTASLATKQSVDTTLTSLAAYNTNGILVQTAADTFVGRTLTGTANRLTVTDGNGVAGDPTINLDTTLLPSPVLADAGKYLKATAANTSVWTALSSSDITTALGFTPIDSAGDTISSGTFIFNGSAILRSLDPVGLTDVATKQYVDTAVSTVSTASGSWTASGTDAYRATGNIGIGLTNPGAPLHVVGTIKAENYGTPPFIVARRSNGTLGSPTAVLSGDILGNWGFTGYTGSGFSGNAVAFKAIAGENFTPSVHGAKLAFYTTPLGGSTLAEVMLIDTNGNVGIGTSAPSASLTVNGEMRSLGSSNGYVGFKAAATTSSTTYTWPTTSGTSSYVLSTDGSGILSWVAQSSGPANTDSLIEGSTNLYFTPARAQSALTASLSNKQDVDTTLTALSGFNTNGILVQTAPDTFVGRAIVGTTSRITVTNGDGVSGSPTINLDTTLFPSPVLADVGKFLKVNAADTSVWAALGSSDITTALGFTPINKAGDTLTGTLTLAAGTFTIGPSGFLIVPNPVLSSDAVNKQYVDGLVGGAWTASGADAYRASGNIGIGITNPTTALDVSGNGNFTGVVMSQSGFLLDPGTVHRSQVTGASSGTNGGSINFLTRTSGLLTEKMRIDDQGNVGINTTSLTATLTVAGTASISGTLMVAGDSMTLGDITFAQVKSNWPYAIKMGISNTADWGSLAIGRSNNLGPSSNGVAVGVANINGGDNSLTLGNSNTAGAIGAVAIGNNISNSITGYLMIGPSDAAKMTITSTGSVGIGTTGPAYMLDVVGDISASGCLRSSAGVAHGVCVSDERLKKDVRPFDLGLEALMGINPKYLKYNGLGGHPKSTQLELGVIAQDVEKTAPELIKVKNVKLYPEDNETIEIKHVNYTAFIYVVINAIKDLYHKWFDDSQVIHREIASLNEKFKNENERLKKENEKIKIENLAIKNRLEKIEKILMQKDK